MLFSELQKGRMVKIIPCSISPLKKSCSKISSLPTGSIFHLLLMLFRKLDHGHGELFIFMVFQIQFFFFQKTNSDAEFASEFPTAGNLLNFCKDFQSCW